MQEVPRALLLPPPGPPLQRNAARGTPALDQDLPDDRAGGAAGVGGGEEAHFLTLLDKGEDTIDVKGKQFRFRPYNRDGATERSQAETVFERPAGDAAAEALRESGAPRGADVASEVLAGFGSGAGNRNSSAFLASFIAQERLTQGLHNPQYNAASNAYRRAGGSPPPDTGAPRVMRFAA